LANEHYHCAVMFSGNQKSARFKNQSMRHPARAVTIPTTIGC
jgi:hypothetical protein